MDKFKYSGRIIEDGEYASIEDELEANKLTADYVSTFNYTEAIAREANKQRNSRVARGENSVSRIQIEKEIRERYAKKIEAMHKIGDSMKKYEKLSEAETDFKNLVYDMKKSNMEEREYKVV